MRVVVLIGFSCTGKSTAVKKLQEDRAFEHVKFVDTDKLIAHEYDNHIYKLFLSLVIGEDRSAADRYITAQEESFLRDFKPEGTTIIAAGPILPTRRPLFDEFVKRTDAKCLWLSITPKMAAERLVKRQSELAEREPEAAQHANFGSWNVPHLATFDNQLQKYVLRDDEQEREGRTAELVQRFEKIYREFAPTDKYFVELPKRQEELVARLKGLVGTRT